MRSIFGIALFALLSTTASAQSAESGVLTAEERKFLIDHLEKTRKDLIDALSGQNFAQWHFKPAEDKWSAANIVEHLIATERYFQELPSKLLQTPAVARKSNHKEDLEVIAQTEDRSKKAQAPEVLKPSGNSKMPAEDVGTFNTLRDKTIEYVRTTQDELRTHVAGKPPKDAYQYLLLLSAHCARHTAQIRENLADPRYPK